MYLLDTNVISELRKTNSGKANPQVIQWANSVPINALFISVITVLEIEMGILSVMRKDTKQGQRLKTWLEQQVIPSFSDRLILIDCAVAKCCAKLHVPDPQSDRDALIAASALVHDFTVVTRNTADFKATGVKLINPWANLLD